VDEWAVIVEVRGGVPQALPTSREIKELLAESFP
jgi:hypothetical protein